MTDLRTHLPLWHASPRSALPAIEAGGIALMREYVWCSLHPLMPIHLFQQFTPDFILSALELPRAGAEGFLWAQTRGAPGGDADERTYDHGGGGIEVKVWTAVPRACIRELVSRDEVEARKVLAQVLARRVAQLELQLREVAARGRYHARLVARQILERRASGSP